MDFIHVLYVGIAIIVLFYFLLNIIFLIDYVHPPGGWIYYFCFFRRPMSDVRCPASRMVSAHLKEKY